MTSFDNAVKELLEDTELEQAYDKQKALIDVAHMLRGWRESANLTQTQLAERIGTKQTVISRLESAENSKSPNLETLTRIAHACNLRLVLGAGAVAAMPENVLIENEQSPELSRLITL